MSKQNDKIIELLTEIRDGLKQQVVIKGKSAEELVEQALSKPKKKLRPEINETWYLLEVDGRVVSRPYYYGYVDNNYWVAGNGFFTKEEAEKELAKRKAKQKIKDYIIENGLEFKVNSKSEKGCYIGYYHDIKKFSPLSLYGVWDASFCFGSMRDANQVIKDCKDSLLILFDVKE